MSCREEKSHGRDAHATEGEGSDPDVSRAVRAAGEDVACGVTLGGDAQATFREEEAGEGQGRSGARRQSAGVAESVSGTIQCGVGASAGEISRRGGVAGDEDGGPGVAGGGVSAKDGLRPAARLSRK